MDDISHAAVEDVRNATTLALHVELTRNDPRSDTIACVLKVTNEGAETLELLDIDVEEAEGVTQTQYLNTQIEKSKREYEETRESVARQIVVRYFDVREEELNRIAGRIREEVTHELDTTTKIPFVSVHLSQSSVESILNRVMGRLRARLHIHTANDAEKFREFFGDESTSSITARALFANVEKMRELEARIDKPIAQLAPGKEFSRAFVFRFKRSPLDTAQYSLHFVCRYRCDGVEESERVTELVSISPHPLPLSATAAGAALAASIVKIMMEQNKIFQMTENRFEAFQAAYFNFWFDVRYAAAAVVFALLFYNIYDFTEVGSKLKERVGWRSAVLIGALCGLLTDRLVAALNAFFGQ